MSLLKQQNAFQIMCLIVYQCSVLGYIRWSKHAPHESVFFQLN